MAGHTTHTSTSGLATSVSATTATMGKAGASKVPQAMKVLSSWGSLNIGETQSNRSRQPEAPPPASTERDDEVNPAHAIKVLSSWGSENISESRAGRSHQPVALDVVTVQDRLQRGVGMVGPRVSATIEEVNVSTPSPPPPEAMKVPRSEKVKEEVRSGEERSDEATNLTSLLATPPPSILTP